MSKKMIIAAWALIMLLSVVACSVTSTPQVIVVTATPEPQAAVLPTSTRAAGNVLGGKTEGQSETTSIDLPTVPPPTQAPTVEEAPAYYTEEFDSDIDNWQYFMASGDKSSMDISTDGTSLVFTIDGQGVWPYVTYVPWIYTDVRIDLIAENRGSNNNSVVLVCRYDPDQGWYEFNVSNGGLYAIYVVHFEKGNPAWDKIYNGGSGQVRPGNATNIYTALCVGDRLSLYVNGTELRTITVPGNVPHIREGRVAVGVNSFDDPNVIVAIDSLTISEP